MTVTAQATQEMHSLFSTQCPDRPLEYHTVLKRRLESLFYASVGGLAWMKMCKGKAWYRPLLANHRGILF